MQVPPPSSTAAQAAGIVSQATAKEKTEARGGSEQPRPAAVSEERVGQSESSSPDRDAQGQGDGISQGGKRKKTDSESDDARHPGDERNAPAVILPGEDPGELDIVG